MESGALQRQNCRVHQCILGPPHLPGDYFRGRGQYLTPHGYLLLSSLERSLSRSLSLAIPAVSPYLALHLTRWDLPPSVLCTHDILLLSWEKIL